MTGLFLINDDPSLPILNLKKICDEGRCTLGEFVDRDSFFLALGLIFFVFILLLFKELVFDLEDDIGEGFEEETSPGGDDNLFFVDAGFLVI